MASFLLRASRGGCSIPLPATWSWAMWQRAAHSWANMRMVTGHAQEDVPKQTIAGRVQSILQSILIKNGAKGSIRWPMAFPWPSQVWLHHHTQSHGALSHPMTLSQRLWGHSNKSECVRTTFRRLLVRPNNQRLIFFSPFPTEKVSK